jgi:hypothetical protein
MDRKTRYSYLFAATIVLIAAYLTAADRDLRQSFVEAISLTPQLHDEDWMWLSTPHGTAPSELPCLAIPCDFSDLGPCPDRTPLPQPELDDAESHAYPAR